MKKLLLVFAHPDDESFSAAGTVAKYVASGWEASLICATRGEVGSRGPYEGTKEPLAEIRQKELEVAGAIIGLSTITFLGYKDGTLAGLSPGELEDKIYRQMSQFAPDIVIAFEPTTGVSNHPDHKKIGLSTTFAFQEYADSTTKPQAPGRRAVTQERKMSLEKAGEITAQPRLYYACLSQSVVEFLKRRHILPPLMFGKPWLGIPDKHITTVIDIRRFKNLKIKALRAHVSQEEDVNRFLSYAGNPLALQEYFILRMEGTTEVFMGKNDRVSNRL